jgi:hypothetical protein
LFSIKPFPKGKRNEWQDRQKVLLGRGCH